MLNSKDRWNQKETGSRNYLYPINKNMEYKGPHRTQNWATQVRNLRIPHFDFRSVIINWPPPPVTVSTDILKSTLFFWHFCCVAPLVAVFTTISWLNNISGAGSVCHQELTAWFLVANGGVLIWVYHFFSCILLIWKLNHTHTSNLDKPMPVTQT